MRLDVDERRGQLLALGVEMFGAAGYDEVSVEAIAQRVGISKGLLYHYFPTKRRFFAAVVEAAAEQLLERVVPDEALPPAERLRHGLAAYFQFVAGYRRAFVALMRGRGSGDLAEIVDRTRERLLERILHGVPLEVRDDPRLALALRGWIGFVEALSLAWAERGDTPVEEPLTLAVETFVTCLATVARGLREPGAEEAVRALLRG